MQSLNLKGPVILLENWDLHYLDFIAFLLFSCKAKVGRGSDRTCRILFNFQKKRIKK
jgi:hypothetical protein